MSSLPRRSLVLVVSAGLLLIGVVSGCGKPTNGIGGLPAIRSERAPVVTLAPGDEVEIKFFYVPELNESQAVRPDGRIALQLVGEVEAQGRTPEQLREELYRLYTPHLNKPDVTVIIRSFHGRRVLVGGEVKRPGMVEMPGPLTALEAIMQAGGFAEGSAAISNVVVIRHKGGQRYGAALDFRQALKGKESVEFLLEPLDIIYVPRTKIVKVAQWIDQHINQLIPMFGVEYSYPSGDGTITIDTTRTRPLR